MSLASKVSHFTGFVPMSTSSQDDLELGRAAVHNALSLLGHALTITVWVFTPWYIALILTLLIHAVNNVLRLYVQFTIAPERFESVGSSIGHIAGRVTSLFTKGA